MASEPNFYAYAMESPHVTVKQQLDSCSMWVFNRTSKRHPPQIWDRRTEYGKDLFLRNQGQLLLAAFSFGDVIVMREPQLVFRSYKDFLHTAVIANQRGIKLAFVRNRFDLKSEAGLRELEAEILRLDSIAVKNMRDKARNGKKLPLGYLWSDTTDAIVPDGATRAVGALIRLLEHQFNMDHVGVVNLIRRTLGSKPYRAKQLHLAMLLNWPDVPPSDLEDLANRTSPSLLNKVSKPIVVRKTDREKIKAFLSDGFHAIGELAKRLDISPRTAAIMLTKSPVSRFIVCDRTGPCPKYTWVQVPPRLPKHKHISPIVEQLAAGGLYEQDPVQEPDQRDGTT
jgi:hypothetical protein